MPIFRKCVAIEIARGVKAFLQVEAGLTCSGLPPDGHEAGARRLISLSKCVGVQIGKVKRLGGRLKRAGRRIIGKKPAARARRFPYPAGSGSVNPENIVWIFGSGRTGSTWLARMMGEIGGHTVWFEPRIGDVFDPSRLRFERRKSGKHFILSERYKDRWMKFIRAFVLDGAQARFPEMTGDDYLVIKEPSGSVAASLLTEAFPESRMVLLLRDPRDALASWVAAHKKGNWMYEWTGRSERKGAVWGTAEHGQEYINEFVRKTAGRFARNVGGARHAYEAHEGHKVLVRYEDLRVDTLEVMKSIYSALEIPVDQKELIQTVEKHSWENIPAKKKGKGKFYRKATPGGWREDLTPEQVKMVERITAPVLRDFYSD